MTFYISCKERRGEEEIRGERERRGEKRREGAVIQ